MKAMALLPAVAAVILALSVSAASSQQACMKEFQACMDGCTNKTAKAIQASCFQGCEGRNTTCAEKIYGKRPFNGAPSAAAEPNDAPKEALAKTERQAAEAREEAPKQAAPEPQRPRQPERTPARR